MSELADLIQRSVDTADGLSVEEFVELALYHPQHGFYMGGGVAGRRGDFLTSPEVGPLFGAVLARTLDAIWSELGRPDPFLVVEAAAGVGTLARSIRAGEPQCWQAVRYLAVERSSALRDEHPDWVESLSDLPDEPHSVGVVIANELLDNLAFGLRHDGADVLIPGPIPELGVTPVQRRAAAWVEQALATLEAGRLIVIDYCATTDELAERPWSEWLRTYRHHEHGSHPFEDPGLQDITVEVCVDQLPPGATQTTQAAFLRRWGIDELVEEGRSVWEERAHIGDLAALRARSRVREAEALLDEQGLGGFTVLEWTVDATPA